LASATVTGVASFGNEFVVSAAGAVGLTSNYVTSVNGRTGNVGLPLASSSATGVASFTNDFVVSAAGAVSITSNNVTTVNGRTGNVGLPLASSSATGVASFTNEFVVSAAGAVSLTSNYVTSVNGRTGNVGLPLASSSATGVASFGNQFVVSNVGAVSLTSNYVISVNGTTGTVTGIAITGSNIFLGLQSLNAGLTTNHLYVSNGATFANGLVVQAGGISITGGATLTGGVAIYGGLNVPSGTITGTLATAAQTNITSVGTLTRLDVGLGGISSAGGITGTLNTAAQTNITSVGTLTRLDVCLGGISSAGGITGTLNTAAQTNITSVGTLTSLSSSGLVTASGGITSNHLYVTNGVTFAGTSVHTGLGTFNAGITSNHLYVTNGATFAGATRIQSIVGGLSVTGGVSITAGANIYGNVVINSSTLSVTGGTAFFNNISVSGNHLGIPNYIYDSSGPTFPSGVTTYTVGDKWTNGSDEYTWTGLEWVQLENIVSSVPVSTTSSSLISDIRYLNVTGGFTASFDATTELLGNVTINKDSSRSLLVNGNARFNKETNIANNVMIGGTYEVNNNFVQPATFGNGVPVLELRGNYSTAETVDLGFPSSFATRAGAIIFNTKNPSSSTLPYGGSGSAYIYSANGELLFGTGLTSTSAVTDFAMENGGAFSVLNNYLSVGMLSTTTIGNVTEGSRIYTSGQIALNNRNAAGSVDMLAFYRGYTSGSNSILSGRVSVAANTTSYVTSSDYRLKMDIEAMTGGIDRVNRMKPCTFKWNNTGEYGEGFIAHELAEVVPIAVVGTKDEMENGKPKYQGIDPRYLVATLTTAIQELDRMVKTQQVEILNLKRRLDSN
jgi:hypothetical protein